MAAPLLSNMLSSPQISFITMALDTIVLSVVGESSVVRSQGVPECTEQQ